MSKPTHNMDVSVVIPFLDEEESLPELYQQLTDVLASTKWSYELIFVDDGSQDKSWEFVRSTAKNDASVRAVKFTRTLESLKPFMWVLILQGNVVFTMDADLQDSPKELVALHEKLTKENLDVVSGWKKVRHDPLFGKPFHQNFSIGLHANFLAFHYMISIVV